MKTKTAFGLAASLLLPLCIGCQAGPGVVRGQNAGMQPPQHMAGRAPQHMAGGAPQATAGPIYYDGPAHGPSMQHMLPNGYGDPGCPSGNCQPMTKVWSPSHHHTWDYQPPQNLSYPPQNQPPAVIQYPYYTLRGPTDFFMK